MDTSVIKTEDLMGDWKPHLGIRKEEQIKKVEIYAKPFVCSNPGAAGDSKSIFHSFY